MCKDFSPLLPSAAVIQPHVSPAGPCQSAILNLTPSTSMDKPRLKLPVTLEDWEEANCYFSQVLVTEVSPDSKNTVLAEGIYANKHGTREPSKRKKRQEKRARA